MSVYYTDIQNGIIYLGLHNSHAEWNNCIMAGYAQHTDKILAFLSNSCRLNAIFIYCTGYMPVRMAKKGKWIEWLLINPSPECICPVWLRWVCHWWGTSSVWRWSRRLLRLSRSQSVCVLSSRWWTWWCYCSSCCWALASCCSALCQSSVLNIEFPGYLKHQLGLAVCQFNWEIF